MLFEKKRLTIFIISGILLIDNQSVCVKDPF